jgi:glycosyltransferase involved in cell wall biosynthesis
MKVSVITATIGKPQLKNCIESVRNQTYKNIEHFVIVDGKEHWDNVNPILFDATFPRGESSSDRLIVLPDPTGKDRFNGHRIYGAFTFLVNGDYVIWLDDDNALEPTHIEKLVNLVQSKNLDWAFSFRQIVDDDGKHICNDDCESLGMWRSVLNDYFVDLNCFFIKKEVALAMSPVWYRKAREPGVIEIDRAISAVLMNERNKLKFDCTREYTLKYRVGSTGISVKAEFFLRGNEAMLKHYNNELPWKK